jgi:hypothetical protein
MKVWKRGLCSRDAVVNRGHVTKGDRNRIGKFTKLLTCSMHCPENNLIRLTIMNPMFHKKKTRRDQELGLTLATANYTGQE